MEVRYPKRPCMGPQSGHEVFTISPRKTVCIYIAGKKTIDGVDILNSSTLGVIGVVRRHVPVPRAFFSSLFPRSGDV